MPNNLDLWLQNPDFARLSGVRKVESKQGKAKVKRADLTDKFLGFWKLASEGLPQPVREHRFHPTRKWRFDLAWVDLALAIEFQGGNWVHGGHNRGAQQQKDFEKLNEAQACGWIVLQFGTNHLNQSRIADTLRTVCEAIEARRTA